MGKKKRPSRPVKKSAKRRPARKKAPAKHPRVRRAKPRIEAVPEKSHLSKLDPMLRLGASRAKV
ncbi:MAG TPA: hypothetical protein VIE88_17285, partial [Vicinamibacteria bacterium]